MSYVLSQLLLDLLNVQQHYVYLHEQIYHSTNQPQAPGHETWLSQSIYSSTTSLILSMVTASEQIQDF